MLRSFRAARRLYSSTNLQLKSFHPRSSSLAVPHRSLSVSPSSSSSFLSLRRTFSTSPADTTSSLPSALSATYGFIDSDKKDHYSEVLSDSEEVIASEQEEIASLSPWYELENELMHDFAREFFLLGPREREERLHRISTLYSNINPDYRSMSDEEIEDRHQLLKERVERLLPTPSLHPVYDADFILYGKGTEKKEQKQLTKKELYESTEGITNEYTGRHLLSESDEELISEAQYRFFRRHVNNKRAVMQAGKKFEMDPETKRTFIHFLYESFEGDGATKDEQLKRWSGLASARWSSADADIENWCKEKERSDRYVSAYNRSVARMYCEAGGDSAGASMYAAGEERNEFDDLFEEKEKKMKEKPSKDAQHTKKIHEKLAEDAAAEERANDLEVGLTDARALKVKLLKKTRGQSTEKFTKEEIGQLLYLIEKATGESVAMEESKILKSFTPYELYVLFELHEVDESPDPKDIEEAEKDKMIREKYESQDDNDLRRISAAFEGKYISPPSDYQPRPLTRFERCLRRALKDDRRAHLLEKFSADFNRKVDAALEERRRRYLEEITEVYIANKEKGVKAEEGGMLKDFEGLAKMMQRQFVESGQARRILDEMLRDYDKKTQKFVLDAYLNGDLRLDLTGGMFNKIDYANLLESVKANAAKSESDDALTLVDNTDDVPVVDELLYDDDEELSKEELEDRRAFENEMSERVDYLKSVISSVVGPPLPKEEPIPSFDHIRTDDEEFTKEVREALQKAYVERRDYDKMIDNLLVSLKIKKPEELSDDPLGELFPDTTVDRDYRQLEKDAQQKQLARDAKRQQKIKNVYLSILGADNPLAKKLSEIDEWNDNEQFFTLAPFHMESIESKIDELNAKRIEAKKNGLPTDLDFEFLLKKRKEYDTAIKKRDEAKDDLVRAVLAANAKLSRAQQALSTLQKDDKKIEFSLSDKDKIPFDYDEELEKLPGADFIATLESLKTPPAIDALARCHLAEEILEKRRDVLIKHLRDAVLDEDPTFAHEIGAIAELNLYAENRILRDAAGYIDTLQFSEEEIRKRRYQLLAEAALRRIRRYKFGVESEKALMTREFGANYAELLQQKAYPKLDADIHHSKSYRDQLKQIFDGIDEHFASSVFDKVAAVQTPAEQAALDEELEEIRQIRRREETAIETIHSAETELMTKQAEKMDYDEDRALAAEEDDDFFHLTTRNRSKSLTQAVLDKMTDDRYDVAEQEQDEDSDGEVDDDDLDDVDAFDEFLRYEKFFDALRDTFDIGHMPTSALLTYNKVNKRKQTLALTPITQDPHRYQHTTELDPVEHAIRARFAKRTAVATDAYLQERVYHQMAHFYRKRYMKQVEVARQKRMKRLRQQWAQICANKKINQEKRAEKRAIRRAVVAEEFRQFRLMKEAEQREKDEKWRRAKEKSLNEQSWRLTMTLLESSKWIRRPQDIDASIFAHETHLHGWWPTTALVGKVTKGGARLIGAADGDGAATGPLSALSSINVPFDDQAADKDDDFDESDTALEKLFRLNRPPPPSPPQSP